MSDSNSHFEKSIASLVEITDAFLRGEFEEALPVIDAEGLLSTLAKKINTMLINMKNVQVPLSHAGAQTPTIVSHAHDVLELMAQSTGEVLDKSGQVIRKAEELEKALEDGGGPASQDCLAEMRRAMYDIIASQSYQDVARQKMEKMIGDLNQMRDWLIEVLVILNIQKDGSVKNVEKKRDLLREVHASTAASPLKQDMVDSLLAEFGF